MRHLGPEPTAYLRQCIQKCRDASHNGKPRTKDVIALFGRRYPELEPSLKPALVVYEASAMGIEMAHGHRPGEGKGGRKKGSKDTKPRKPRPSAYDDVLRLYVADRNRSAASIAEELDITRAAAAKWVKRIKAAEASRKPE